MKNLFRINMGWGNESKCKLGDDDDDCRCDGKDCRECMMPLTVTMAKLTLILEKVKE